MTNADKIRALTNEELAELLEYISNLHMDAVDSEQWLEWLKEEGYSWRE